MKVFIHEYGMALLSMLMCVFLTVTASPVSTQIQGAMTDVVNQATDVANFNDLEIISDGSIGSYNDKKVLKAELSCNKTTSNDDLSSQKDLFTVTVTYSDNTSEEIPAADIISINTIKEDNSGITYTATIKGKTKNFDTNKLTIGKITPIYAGYNPNDTTLYFANTEREIKDAGVDLSGTNYYGNISNNCSYKQGTSPWSSQLSTIININILSEIKPSSCRYWFDNCSNVTSVIGLEKLDTSNVQDMMNMFYGCSKLTELNLSNFKTKNVKTIQGMFMNCSSLKSLNLSNFDTSNLTNRAYLFRNTKIETLDVSNWKNTKLTDMSELFSIPTLKSINLDGFNTDNVKSMESMFAGCSRLQSINLSSFNTKNVTSMKNMFKNCSSLTSLNVNNINTSNVQDMMDMFYGCSKLTELDLSHFEAKNVKTLQGMFWNCSSLKSLDLSNFDTKNVSNFAYMFYGCSNLNSIDMSNFNATSAVSLSYMFYNCKSLKDIDLSFFKPTKLSSINYMFSGAINLRNVDISGLDTSNITDIRCLFYQCENILTINLGEFKTDKMKETINAFTSLSSNSKVYTTSQKTKDFLATITSGNVILGTPE